MKISQIRWWRDMSEKKNIYTIEEFAEKAGIPEDLVYDGIGNWIPWEDVRIQEPTEEQAKEWKKNKNIPREFIGIAVAPQVAPNGEVW